MSEVCANVGENTNDEAGSQKNTIASPAGTPTAETVNDVKKEKAPAPTDKIVVLLRPAGRCCHRVLPSCAVIVCCHFVFPSWYIYMTEFFGDRKYK